MPIHAADAIRITIGHETKIVRMSLQERLTAGIVGLNGFGINTTKQGVMGAIECGHFAGRSREQLLETTRAHAKQGFVREAQFGLRDEFEIYKLLQRGVMCRTNIFDRDLFRCHATARASGRSPRRRA